jgi:hypothetical protein
MLWGKLKQCLRLRAECRNHRQLRAHRGARHRAVGRADRTQPAFFAIGEQRMPLDVIHALAWVKRAAAEVNATLGLLEPTARRPSPHAARGRQPASSTPSSRCRCGRPAPARRAT